MRNPVLPQGFQLVAHVLRRCVAVETHVFSQQMARNRRDGRAAESRNESSAVRPSGLSLHTTTAAVVQQETLLPFLSILNLQLRHVSLSLHRLASCFLDHLSLLFGQGNYEPLCASPSTHHIVLFWPLLYISLPLNECPRLQAYWLCCFTGGGPDIQVLVLPGIAILVQVLFEFGS